MEAIAELELAIKPRHFSRGKVRTRSKLRHKTASNIDSRAIAFRQRPWVAWVIVASDVLALQLSLLGGFLFREALSPWMPIGLNSTLYTELALVMLTFPLLSYFAGLYPGYGLTSVERLQRRTKLTCGFFALLLVVYYLFGDYRLSRGVLLATFFFTLILYPLVKSLVISVLVRRGWWGTPVLVLGGANTGAVAVKALLGDPAIGLKPVAVLDDDPKLWGSKIEGVPVVGSTDRAAEFSGVVTHAMLAMPGASRARLTELYETLPFPHVMIIPDLFGMQSLWVQARDLGGVLGLELKKQLLLRKNLLIKRTMDYLLGIPLFLLSLPILALSVLWIKVVSPGPAFFVQKRGGQGGRSINVLKLRTMYLDADELLKRHLAEDPAAHEEWHKYFKLKNDPRILPGIGRLLRKTSLDELPQIWNVLRGDMSLVGPRPFPGYHLEMFKPEFRAMRLSVLPGMTGLWQVSARSDGDLVIQEKLDSYYIRNWSIWMDYDLLYRTVWVVLKGKGAY